MSKKIPNPPAEESEPRLPTDLRKALAAAPAAKAQWRDLTPIARRDFISWMDSAKQPQTRKRRIEKACSTLAAGKRRPCCYSIVPFNLYKTLAANPMAKAQWSDLTPIERRDFISRMDSDKQPEATGRRVEKACAMLAAGQRPKRGRQETKSTRFTSVEEYLVSLDAAKARTVGAVIDFILTQFPELESKISWNVPQIHWNGKYVVGVAAFRNHLTLAPWSQRVIEDFRARLRKFVVNKNCFQIPVDWEIDHELVKDLVRARLAEVTNQKEIP